MVAGLLLALGVILWVLPSISRGLNTVSMMITSFGKGRYKTIRRIQIKSTDEIGQIATVFKEVSNDLEEAGDRESLCTGSAGSKLDEFQHRQSA